MGTHVLCGVLLTLGLYQAVSSCSLENIFDEMASVAVSDAVAKLIGGGRRSRNTVAGAQIDFQETRLDTRKDCRPRDCADVAHSGETKSGVYKIWPSGWESCGTYVYCDLELDDGGWTVIQRRGDFGNPTDFFYKRWRDYKFGFGNLTKDFWLGNDKIFHITNQDNYILKIDLKSKDGEATYAQYDEFFIGPESDLYRLSVYGFKGDSGDSFSGHNGHAFGTQDRDTDQFDKNCAVEFRGAWWYNKCHESNLNGLYHNGPHDSFANGVNWKAGKGYHYSYKDTVMKIRPKSYWDKIEASAKTDSTPEAV